MLNKPKILMSIIGWSLGGQLATLLVAAVEQQYQQQKVLITLASNPCFVAHEQLAQLQ